MAINLQSYLTKYLKWLGTQDRETLFKYPDGRSKTSSLFFEFRSNANDYCHTVFTTKRKEYTTPEGQYCWSFPLLYLAVGDPTEYRVGTDILYDYTHFKRIAANAMFRKMINQCREDLEFKLRSDAIQDIKALTKNISGGTALAAAKFLAKREWIDDKKTKEAILREQKFVSQIEDEMAEDLQLLNVHGITNK